MIERAIERASHETAPNQDLHCRTLNTLLEVSKRAGLNDHDEREFEIMDENEKQLARGEGAGVIEQALRHSIVFHMSDPLSPQSELASLLLHVLDLFKQDGFRDPLINKSSDT